MCIRNNVIYRCSHYVIGTAEQCEAKKSLGPNAWCAIRVGNELVTWKNCERCGGRIRGIRRRGLRFRNSRDSSRARARVRVSSRVDVGIGSGRRMAGDWTGEAVAGLVMNCFKDERLG